MHLDQPPKNALKSGSHLSVLGGASVVLIEHAVAIEEKALKSGFKPPLSPNFPLKTNPNISPDAVQSSCNVRGKALSYVLLMAIQDLSWHWPTVH